MKVVVAVDGAALLVEGLRREGIDVIAEVGAAAPALAATDGMLGTDAETLLRALATWQRVQAFLRFAVEDRFDPAEASDAMIRGLLRAVAEDAAADPLEDLEAAAAGMRWRAAEVMAVFDRLIGPPPTDELASKPAAS